MSVAPMRAWTWCAASYHDAPFERSCTSSHVSSSDRTPPFFATGMAIYALDPAVERNLRSACAWNACLSMRLELPRTLRCTYRLASQVLRTKLPARRLLPSGSSLVSVVCLVEHETTECSSRKSLLKTPNRRQTRTHVSLPIWIPCFIESAEG